MMMFRTLRRSSANNEVREYVEVPKYLPSSSMVWEVSSGESRGNLLSQRFIFFGALIFTGAAGDTVITKMQNAKAQAGGYVRNL